jgi:hypothetical protein
VKYIKKASISSLFYHTMKPAKKVKMSGFADLDFLDVPIQRAKQKAAERGVPATFLSKTP